MEAARPVVTLMKKEEGGDEKKCPRPGLPSPKGCLTVFLFKEKLITPSREDWEGSALGGGMTVGSKGLSGWLETHD